MTEYLNAPSMTKEVFEVCQFGAFKLVGCEYDIKGAPIYFSLGEALVGISLILIVFQLKKKSWDLVLRIKSWYVSYCWVLFLSIGVLTTIFAAILHYFYFNFSPPFNSPIIYELTAFISMLLAPVVLWRAAQNTDKLYNNFTAAKFYQVMIFSLSRATPDIMEAVTNILLVNLDNIAKAAQKYNDLKDEDINLAQYSQVKYAYLIFRDVLSQHALIDYFSTSRYDSIIVLFNNIKKYKLTRSTAGIAVYKITLEMFKKNNSHFYAQLQAGGFRSALNIFKIIFFDQYILNEFRPLQRWYLNISKDNYLETKNGLKVYLEAIKFAIKGYWFDESRSDTDESLAIQAGFSDLGHFATSIISEWNKELGYTEQKKQLNMILFDIVTFVNSSFVEIYDDAVINKKVNQHDLNARHTNKFNEESLTSSYAELIYRLLCSLSSAPIDNDYIREKAQMLTNHIFSPHDDKNSNYENIGNRLVELIWNQINYNSNGIGPPILRAYLEILMPGEQNDNEWTIAERNKLLENLNRIFKPKFLKNEKMRNGKDLMEEVLLPDYIKLNRKTNNYEFVFADGKIQILQIIIPKGNNKSIPTHRLTMSLSPLIGVGLAILTKIFKTIT